MASYTIYLLEIYYVTCTLFLAGKDATSYLLKAKSDDRYASNRVKRWHRDGVALAILALLPCIVIAGDKWYWIVAGALLIRAAIFDLAFNAWSSLPTDFLGGTAWFDKLFIRIFGVHGADTKSAIFLIILGALQYFIYKY